MQELTGKVAVVTGAASGIGRALAERLAAESMKVVVADVDMDRLAQTEQALTESGTSTVAIRADVSRAEDVKRLAEETLDAFGAVHVVCNNAGVCGPTMACWEQRAEDWDFVFGVNLNGILHGIRTFVPILLEQNEDAHVVNTVSASGFLAGPFAADYLASKHAALSRSETPREQETPRRRPPSPVVTMARHEASTRRLHRGARESAVSRGTACGQYVRRSA